MFESLKTDKLEDQKQALESGTTQLWNRQMQLNYRTHGISNTVTNMMSGIFAGVSNRAVLQIGWCFK